MHVIFDMSVMFAMDAECLHPYFCKTCRAVEPKHKQASKYFVKVLSPKEYCERVTATDQNGPVVTAIHPKMRLPFQASSIPNCVKRRIQATLIFAEHIINFIEKLTASFAYLITSSR
jgi:hypothetical protein